MPKPAGQPRLPLQHRNYGPHHRNKHQEESLCRLGPANLALPNVSP